MNTRSLIAFACFIGGFGLAPCFAFAQVAISPKAGAPAKSAPAPTAIPGGGGIDPKAAAMQSKARADAEKFEADGRKYATASSCERWAGKEFIARSHGPASACMAGCTFAKTVTNGGTSRYKITGAPCSR